MKELHAIKGTGEILTTTGRIPFADFSYLIFQTIHNKQSDNSQNLNFGGLSETQLMKNNMSAS